MRRDYVRQWLHKAKGDLKASRHLLDGDAECAFGAAFHAQQAAEKALKAVLVWHQVDFPKTHNLGRLSELLRAVVGQLPAAIAQAIALNPYGVEARYPADLPEPTVGEASEAFALAERVHKAVLALLPAEFGRGHRAAD